MPLRHRPLAGVAALLVAAALSASASAAVIVVPTDRPTIREAVEAARPGDTVLVRNGTYAGGIPLRSGVTVRGESRDGVVVLGTTDGPSVGFDFYDFDGQPVGLEGAVVETLTLRGFTRAVRFADNFTQEAPRPRSLTLRGLLVEDCGEGFWLSWNASPSGLLVEGNEIRGGGAGVTLTRAGGDVRVTGNRIVGAYTGIDVTTYSSPTLDHNVVVGSRNVGIALGGTRSTAVHNTVVGGNVGLAVSFDDAAVHSNVVADNLTAVSVYFGSPTFRHNVYWNNVGQGPERDSTETVADPAFVGDGSYRLGPGSGAIDAGAPDAPYDLEPAYNGRRADAGAYGNTPLATPSAPEIAATTVATSAAGVGAFAGVEVTVENAGRTRLDLRSVRVEGAGARTFVVEGERPDAVPAGGAVVFRAALASEAQGTYEGALVVETNDEDEPTVTVPLRVRRVERVHVRPSSPTAAVDPGATWATAYGDLSGAAAFADSLRGQVGLWVAGGTYRPSGDGRRATFRLRDGVSLLGGFSGSEASPERRDPTAAPTVLSGDLGVAGDPSDNAYHVLTVRSTGGEAPAVVDGVTVEGGRADDAESRSDNGVFSGGLYGGGLLGNGVPLVLTRSTFRLNYGSEAGGVYCEGCEVAASDVVFQGNTAEHGAAGMQLRAGSATIERATFEGNRSVSGAGGMGVVEADYVLADSRFADNVSGGYGGGFSSAEGSGRVERVALEGNRALGYNGVGGGAFVAGGTATTVEFADVLFARNEASAAGGLRVTGGAGARVERTRFVENRAEAAGGGLVLDDGYQGRGGGRHEVADVVFEGNRAGGDGGGAVFGGGESAVVRDVRFVRNQSGGAGAMGVSGMDVGVFGAEFLGNAGGLGGAVTVYGDDDVTVANATFVGNRAGDAGSVLMSLVGRPTLVNVTMAANGPRAVASQNPTSPRVYNAVAWPVEAPFFHRYGDAFSGGTITVDHALVEGGTPGTAVITGDPLYVSAPSPGPDGAWGTADDDYGDLRLRAGSPALDAGLASWLPADAADLDGDRDRTEPLPADLAGAARVQGRVDLGAYEGVAGAVAAGEDPDRPEGLAVVGPNPSAGRTAVALWLAAPADRAMVALYDVLGRRVAVLHDGPAAAGRLDVAVDGDRLPSGAYVVRASTGSASWTARVTVAR